MPLESYDSDLGWKTGVPTTGVQGIGSNVVGNVDQYLAAMDFHQPPARHHRIGRVRSGHLSTTGQGELNTNCKGHCILS